MPCFHHRELRVMPCFHRRELRQVDFKEVALGVRHFLSGKTSERRHSALKPCAETILILLLDRIIYSGYYSWGHAVTASPPSRAA